MNSTMEPLTFTVSLALSARSKAKQFSSEQSNPDKAKQIYYNTLAVYAVNFYLQCLGFETDLDKSNSWNPVMRSLTDVADLEIKDYGKLECRPVLPNSELCYVPPIVWSERIGYVAVQLNESFTEATLLGFTEKVETKEFPLSQLRSLDDLPKYIKDNRLMPEVAAPLVPTLTNLRQWLQENFEAGWQSFEALFGTTSLAYREPQKTDFAFRKLKVRQAKPINLGLQLAQYPMALVVTLTPKTDSEQHSTVQEFAIRVQVCPLENDRLPEGLKLVVVDESGKTFLEISNENNDNFMQTKLFSGQPGEQFAVKLALGETSFMENFVV